MLIRTTYEEEDSAAAVLDNYGPIAGFTSEDVTPDRIPIRRASARKGFLVRCVSCHSRNYLPKPVLLGWCCVTCLGNQLAA